MKKTIGLVFLAVGVLFILYAVFGRYQVLPGYLAGLGQGRSTVAGAIESVDAWKVARYLLWAYSFKLGIYFFMIGVLLRTAITSAGFVTLAAGGFFYILFAYIPLPFPRSYIFGIGGVVMTIFMLSVFFRWTKERALQAGSSKTAIDLRMIGYFFFAMATYTLCPLMGVKGFALQPEKMIEYGLLNEAGSFAYHVLIELVLGWLFLFLGSLPRKADKSGEHPGD